MSDLCVGVTVCALVCVRWLVVVVVLALVVLLVMGLEVGALLRAFTLSLFYGTTSADNAAAGNRETHRQTSIGRSLRAMHTERLVGVPRFALLCFEDFDVGAQFRSAMPHELIAYGLCNSYSR